MNLVKLLEKNIEGNTSGLESDKDFLGQKNHINYKRKIDKFDFSKFKNCYHLEDIEKMKRQIRDKGDIFAKHTPEKRL